MNASTDPARPPHRCSSTSTSSRATAPGRPRSAPSPTSRSPSMPASSSPSWARRAAASRPCSTSPAALEQPTAGRVLVDGRDLAEMSASEQAELRRNDVGYVFQSLNLIPALTALENVMLPLELDGTSSRAARRLAREALDGGRVAPSSRPVSRRLLRRSATAHRHRSRRDRQSPAAARRRADRGRSTRSTAIRSSSCSRRWPATVASPS